MLYLHKSADVARRHPASCPRARRSSSPGRSTTPSAAPRAEPAPPPARDRALRLGRGLSRRAGRAARALCRLDAGAARRAVRRGIFVDKHHVQERVFAKHAGLGWIGKNTCVINPRAGLVDACSPASPSASPLPPTRRSPTSAAPARCASTRARPARSWTTHELDATRCISYLTIELDGPIPGRNARHSAITSSAATSARRSARGTWRRWRRSTRRGSRAPAARLPTPPSCGSGPIDALHEFVAGIGHDTHALSRLRRNLAVVLGNSGDPAAAECWIAPAAAALRRNAAHMRGRSAVVARPPSPGPRTASWTARDARGSGPAEREPEAASRLGKMPYAGLRFVVAPVLLVSMPQMLDPNFARTVVLLAEYGKHGAFGLVVNRQMAEPAHEVIHARAADGHPQGRPPVRRRTGRADRAWVLTAHARARWRGARDHRRRLPVGVAALDSPRAAVVARSAGAAGHRLCRLGARVSSTTSCAVVVADRAGACRPGVRHAGRRMWETAIRRLGAEPSALQAPRACTKRRQPAGTHCLETCT